MAEITLRDYLRQIDNFIKDNRLEEATAHSAHILQRYPKNVMAYRTLGRGLMQLKRYDEAGEVFRRLLGALPDDFAAHYQLSIVHDELNQANEAIWHIERAFDQQSGNPTVNERLRSLYQKYRNHDVEKIQLTAGAVSNQYIAAGMFIQAIELLQRTLRKMPDRNDLKLKLARAQWQGGLRVDAAESAIDVLKTYPYSVDANRILTEFWLDEDRPSDAQRYLSRIEDVDPYLAMQLATGEIVSADTFMIEELDFQRYAAAITSSGSPDWLDNLSMDASASSEIDVAQEQTDADADFNDDDWLAEFIEEDPPAAKKKVTDDLSNLLPDDFDYPDSVGKDDTVAVDDLPSATISEQDDIDNLLSIGESEGTGLTGLLGDDQDAWMDDLDSGGETTVKPATTGGLTGMLAKLGGDEEADQDDDDDWLRELAASNVVSGVLSADALDDILSDDDDDILLDDLFGNSDTDAEDVGLAAIADVSPSGESANDDLDPMAWLKEVDDSVTDDEPIDEIAATDTKNSFAWVQDTNIEFDDDANVVPTLFDEGDPVSLESAPEAPMAWLEEEGIDFEPDAEMEAEDTTNLSYYEEGQEVDDQQITDPLAWLADADAELEEDDISAPDATDSELDSSMDWLTDDSVLDEMLDLDDLTQGDTFAASHAASDNDDEPVVDDGLDNLFEDSDWQDDDFAEDEESLGDLDWLAEDDLLEDDLLEDDDLPVAELADSDTLSWLHQADTEPERSDAIQDIGDESDDEDDEQAVIADSAVDDPMAWLSESGIELDDDEQPVVDDDIDWVSDFQDEADVEELFADGLSTDEDDSDFDFVDDATELPPLAKSSMLTFLNTDADDTETASDDWVGEIDVDDVFAESEADWLSDIGGADSDIEEESDLDWMSPSDEDVEPVTEAHMDWISEISDDVNDSELELDDEAIEGSDMDWMSEISDDDDDEFQLDDEPVAEADADWLSELSDDDSELEIAEADADWLSELSDDDSELEIAEADADWLSELSDDDNDSELEITEADADWLSELGDDDSELEITHEPVAEVDWGDYEAEADNDLVAEADADWLSELSDDDSELEIAEADADWLSELGDDDSELEITDEPVAEVDWGDYEAEADDDLVAEEDADWLGELGDDDSELEIAEADADWLSEPGDDDSELEITDEPVAEVDWGADFDDAEEDLSVASTSGMTGLLNTIRQERDTNTLESELDSDDEVEASDLEPVAETDLDDMFADEPDWLGTLDSDEDTAQEPVAQDTVDWGLDDSTEIEAVPLAESEAGRGDLDEETEFIAEAESAETDFDYDEEVEFASADNAPDWLNAMVPGLDLDYEAEEDEPIDEGFSEGQTHRQRVLAEEAAASTSDFTWLQDIVDEETGNKPISDDSVTEKPVARPSVRRFIFSKLPTWLRGDSAASVATAEEAIADVAIADFDDFGAASDDELMDDFDSFDNFDSQDTIEDMDDFDSFDDFGTMDTIEDIDDFDDIDDDFEFDDDFDDL
ncbi:MAG: hypothetical protein Q9P44_13440 [Anaerolineae bacterium]|nr:hypothetical protein [Anaerolineae bacterium]